MEYIVHYFDTIPSWHRALILAGGITFFWILEGIVPLFRFKYRKWKHAGLNIFFTLTTVIINFTLAIFIVKASDWTQQEHFGLLHIWQLPLWVKLVAGLLLLDFFGAWCIHYIQHKVKWMWRFHMVHHADLYIDTTTANRHHPGESVLRAVATIIGVLICGAPIWLVMCYQSISVVLSQFNHANIKLPDWLDKTICWLIVSPNMHKVHHHYKRPQTDSNYGNIFSIWDKLFGTFDATPVSALRYGLDVLDDDKSAQIAYQLNVPFDSEIKTGF